MNITYFDYRIPYNKTDWDLCNAFSNWEQIAKRAGIWTVNTYITASQTEKDMFHTICVHTGSCL